MSKGEQFIATTLGTVFFMAGVLGALYFFHRFDTSPTGSTENIGLLNQRTNGIMLSCTGMIVGSLFLLLPRSRD